MVRPDDPAVDGRTALCRVFEGAEAAHPRIDAIPFESEHKFMATLHKDTSGKQFTLVKGAPKSNNVAKPIRTTFRRGHGRCKEGFRWGSPWWPRV
jgi:magnesium-transporting ATPase (P-type)